MVTVSLPICPSDFFLTWDVSKEVNTNKYNSKTLFSSVNFGSVETDEIVIEFQDGTAQKFFLGYTGMRLALNSNAFWQLEMFNINQRNTLGEVFFLSRFFEKKVTSHFVYFSESDHDIRNRSECQSV